jgi:hypothetical protein
VVMDGVEEVIRVFGLGLVGLVGLMSVVGHKVSLRAPFIREGK